jgi:phage replication-related protein YjqB (UPF0714/DUF867 family)
MGGRYRSFAELEVREREGWDFRVRWRRGESGILFMAPHGGCIEPGTTEIAEAAAGEEHGFYTFSGTKESGNRFLHITSTLFDEPRALDALGEASIVITVHGSGHRAAGVFVGGRDADLGLKVTRNLQLAGFEVWDSPPGLKGTGRANVCNRGTTGRGVQMEVSNGLRRRMFSNLKRPGRAVTTDDFYRFVEALRAALAPDGSEPPSG